MRLINFVSLGILLGLVFLIYELKYETRRLEARAATLSKEIAEEKDNLAVMRAEWSYRSRPELVEQMAGELLGLQPVKPEQIIPFEDIAVNESRRGGPGAPASRKSAAVETTGAIARQDIARQDAVSQNAASHEASVAARGEGRRDDIGALINSLSRRTGDERPTR